MSKILGDALLGICSDAQNHLFIVAPYIKADALKKILTEANSIVSLVCITRWRPDDIIFGASDVECRAMIIERGGSFRLHPSLHAKYYRADDIVLIGSANLTNSALGWARNSNLEILCGASGDFDAQAFERNLLSESREISDIEFAHWASISKIDAPRRKKISGPQPSLDDWRPATRELHNLEFAYKNSIDEIASSDEQGAAQRDIQALSIPQDLADDEVRAWISTCLLAAPFVNSVMQLSKLDKSDAVKELAKIYGLNLTDARRDMETVQNWLRFLSLSEAAGATPK